MWSVSQLLVGSEWMMWSVSLLLLNFVVAQLTGLLLGFGLRFFLPHSLGRPAWRLLYCLLSGLYLLWFMIGWSTWLVLFQVFVCYALLKYFPQNHMQVAVFCFALGYMLTLYVLRLLENFEHLCYDPTYPLMITTQKLTSLAFSISDWRLLHKHGKQLDQERQKWAVRQMPSLLEYFSFVLSFQGILAGPFCHYNTFRAFIEGNTQERLQVPSGCLSYTCNHSLVVPVVSYYVILSGQLFFYTVRSVIMCTVRSVIMCTLLCVLSVQLLCVLSGQLLCVLSGQLLCLSMCFPADAIYNASGMGYAGKDEHGRHQWTEMSNVFVFKIETATSPKVYMDNWNILTTHWLRYVCYTRAPYWNTLLTFMLSAAWHGLFIGYYVTFVSAAFTVQAARRFRANVRPLFQSSPASRLLYDIFTFVATQLSISFLVLSFVVLKWEPTVRFHSSFYWCLHVITAVILIVLPSKKSPRAPLKQEENHHNKHQDQQNHHQKHHLSEKQSREQQQDQMDGREKEVYDIAKDGDGRVRQREVMFVQKS
ncbi:unnamed protein product [Candidula unifasciata]|uniref:Membrane bound O-acyltransferase domain containing 2a n=1 Tax=Candidula unifasciata TaxID=100452 RepID=A0A8S3Z7Y2_9EUPU|nr:unnamed protein product [Candidula unifasciata]